MHNTFYDSPHGLANSNNLSTVEDQALLIQEATKNLVFRKYAGGTTIYKC